MVVIHRKRWWSPSTGNPGRHGPARASKDLEEDRLFKIAEAMARADQLRDDTAAKEIQKKWISSRTWFGMKLQLNGAEPPFANPFPDRDPNNPTLLPQTTKHLRDITFVPIVPSEAIDRWPRLLTGVLNFSPKKARWLVGLGYRDMLVAIKSRKRIISCASRRRGQKEKKMIR